jgi:hypothetical protein
MTTTRADWIGEDGSLAAVVRAQSHENLQVYAASAVRVDEDAGQEMSLAHGGYGKRQILELVQNGADAMLAQPGGRIHLVLTTDHLYCANEGDAIDEPGIGSLLHAHISNKRDAEIGRFGLGFKSVLGVTDRPEFFCREVSFGFDGAWAKPQISAVAPDRKHYPSLRLARLIDPHKAAAEDAILSELMSFATTVVRLPRTLGTSDWLGASIAEFDPAFMLFSPHVGELILEDRMNGIHRAVTLHSDADDVTITEGSDSRRWRVFKSTIRPSNEAKREAWELSARDVLPLVWAVPVEGKLAVGRFWAFFPLRDETTLTGIANAPWQINDDRTGLLDGSRLNTELLEELMGLVLRSLPRLAKKDDPGWILDVIPARGDEARCWGDKYLSSRFYDLAIDRPVIPDQDGHSQRASDLRLPPNVASRVALDAWSTAPARPTDWCHSSSLSSPTRRSRVERLFERIGKREESPRRWLECLVGQASTVEDVAHAIIAAAAFVGAPDSLGFEHRRSFVHRSRILLDSVGALVDANPRDIFIPRASGSTTAVVRLADPDLVRQPGVPEALAVIGLEELTPALELKAFLRRQELLERSAAAWDAVWTLVRALEDVEEARVILAAGFRYQPICVRTMGGFYRPLVETLLPGSIVPADGSRDADVAVDTAYHRVELEVLRLLGSDQAPADGFPVAKDPLVDEYRSDCIDKYIAGLPPGGSTPQSGLLVFDRENSVGPLEPLRHLSEHGRAIFVDALIQATLDWRPWNLKHETQPKYPQREFPSPAVWAIIEHGRLKTSRGVFGPKRVWGPAFRRWADLVPVAELPEEAVRRLSLPNKVKELTLEHWSDAFRSIAVNTDDGLIGGFYAFAAGADAPSPDLIRCRLGASHDERPAAEVVVTASRDAFRALRDLEKPCVLVTTEADALALIASWGLSPASSYVRQETNWIQSGSSTSLLDALPTLRSELEAAGVSEMELVPCLEIVETVTTDTGTRRVDKEFEHEGNRFLWRTDLGLEEALRRLSRYLPFKLDDEEIIELAEGRWQQERREKLTSIREQPTLEDRLLAAVGEGRLKTSLPVGLLDAVVSIHGLLTPADIARLTLVVHGEDTLHQFRDDLRAAGLEPPDRWAGSAEARAFVQDLGFPAEFAGARSAPLEPELVVLGPPNLPPLHDYQRQIVAEIDNLLNDGGNPRGLLSLPTGAGKTRVAVQALVEALSAGRLASPVLWIAQSEELCEQAVQTWSDVWRGLGAMDELRIGRLWGPANEVPQASEAAQVVVATVDKLRFRVNSSNYTWLGEASCIVIDEAHGATTPEYTALLTWLGIRQTGGTTTTRAPLVGLTATPFRGTSKRADRTSGWTVRRPTPRPGFRLGR